MGDSVGLILDDHGAPFRVSRRVLTGPPIATHVGMSRARRYEVEGAVYHVTARGDGRRAVFRSAGEMETYLEHLGRVGAWAGWALIAYCLMTNHVHLLLRLGPVSLGRTMNRLQSGFVRRTNRSARTEGRRFGDRYRAVLVQSERHILAATLYIHRNPVSAGIVRRPEKYAWSSARAYLGGIRLCGVRPDEVFEWTGGPSGYADLLDAVPEEHMPTVRWKGVPVLGEPGPELVKTAGIERRRVRSPRVVDWAEILEAADVAAAEAETSTRGRGHMAARWRAAALTLGDEYRLSGRAGAALLGYAAGSTDMLIRRARDRISADPRFARNIEILRARLEGEAAGARGRSRAA